MTTYDGKTIVVDPCDLKGNVALMERADEFTAPYLGENEEGEKVVVSVNKDNITVQTFQKNDWVRTNIYHEDGYNEEMFSK